MAIQTLRDAKQKIIAYIETRSDGVMVIRDFNQRIKGYYDPKSNFTRDFNQKIIGSGNLLTTLL